jgi:transcriptional regulator with XRE-family HTH domain
MSSVIFTPPIETISGAIRGLRERLGGISQDAMARRIGCTVSAYVQWEQGRRVPAGDWLLKVLQLCPDADSLRTFGIDCSQLKSQPAEADKHLGLEKPRGERRADDGRAIKSRYSK